MRGPRARIPGALFLTLVLALVGAAACEPAHLTALTVDAADPDVVFDGHQYVLHTTNTRFGNVPTYTSTDLVNWRFVGDALPVLPAWAASGYTWAPSAIRRPDGKWFLYFSAAVRGKKTPNGQPLKCVGVAAGPTPTGPYTVVKERNAAPFLCTASAGGTIDPSPFRNPANGLSYLVTKVDGNAAFRGTSIENRRLDANLWNLTPGFPSTLLTSTSGTWEGRIVEGPDLLTAAGGLHLLYSGGDFSKAAYGEGQARCGATNRACVRNGRLLDNPLDGVGAGGASEFTGAAGVSYLAWHSFQDSSATGPRVLSVAADTVSAAGVLGITEPTAPTSASPTPSPTVSPTPPPTVGPTVGPTPPPTVGPTVSPTPPPTVGPTVSPTPPPTVSPTPPPTVGPTTAGPNAARPNAARPNATVPNPTVPEPAPITVPLQVPANTPVTVPDAHAR